MKTEFDIQRIVEKLSNQEIVCLPTDTLFALSCDATNKSAVNNLYQIKMRELEKKLPVLFCSLEHVMQHCELSNQAIELARKFWPGPLTMIVKLKETSNIAQNVFDHSNFFIAVRIPKNDEIFKIIQLLNKPIIGTSANISGTKNLITYEEIYSQFSLHKVTLFKSAILNMSFQPSTIISFENTSPIIVRQGQIPDQALAL